MRGALIAALVALAGGAAAEKRRAAGEARHDLGLDRLLNFMTEP
jgi:hypothetical protein